MENKTNKRSLGKLWNNKFFAYVAKNNPFRGELVEVDMRVVGGRMVYTYTKVREHNFS